MTFGPDYLEEAPAAKLLGFATSTLRRWRRLGTGPLYRQVGDSEKGPAMYRRADLMDWKVQRILGITHEEWARFPRKGGSR
jgi:hypothetical protein